jgi:predicted glycosyltransferase
MSKPQKILFYLGHPAHYHFFSRVFKQLQPDQYVIAIKSKDVLEQLLKENHLPFINIDKDAKGAGRSFIKMFKDLLLRSFRLYKIARKHRATLLAASAVEIAIIGKWLGIPSYVFFEDDFEKIKPFAKIAGPLATVLVCPDCCSAWKWNHKKTGYAGYHELAYLHPDHFTPDESVAFGILEKGKRNFLLRFSQLGAYHDKGISGLTDDKAMQLVNLLSSHGKVLITSERPLPPLLEPYRIAIKASDIHHVLAFADLYIGDSQTMTAEAAVLGTPALRFNDFVRELSYLEELEFRYDLTYGFKTNEFDSLIEKAKQLLAVPDLKESWAAKRNKMLSEKINVAQFFTRLLLQNKNP